MNRTVVYEIIESVERAGYWELWATVRKGEVERRILIDQRCTRY